MAFQSMTGFGSAETVEKHYSVRVEMRSVNNRYLDFQLRLPRELSALEPSLRKALGAEVTRGSISCQVTYENRSDSAITATLNQPLWDAYQGILRKMASDLGEKSMGGISDLLKIPDLVQVGQGQEETEALEARILPVFTAATRSLVIMRLREGEALRRELETRMTGFQAVVKSIQEEVPKRQSDYAERMRQRMREIAGETPLNEDRLVTEIGILAERLDVTEELVRLDAHLHHFLEVLEQSSSPGKKLGFLLQEMLREVNTLGTKSQHAPIQHACVGLKEELEILREQLANVE
jgi:uncharacterized protein (TIGR00255 family)